MLISLASAKGAPGTTTSAHVLAAVWPGPVLLADADLDEVYVLAPMASFVMDTPRNPYARVDALRSTRSVRVELDGVVLAESSSPVVVFETGLPPRSYLPRTAVDFTSLVRSPTRTECPYKGRTSAYWSAETGSAVHPDIAWSYDFPTREMLPIAGLVAFYDEKVDVVVDGRRRPRPRTPFSD